MSQDFPTIVKQAKGITYAYKLIGLYSIVLLTAVTIVSMTNVFTSGEFAQFPWIRNTWAFIFALAIDVNIVRLFVEGKLDKSTLAYVIGTGLAIVTGAALFIEGLQQSIGLKWDDEKVHIIIAFLVGFRVLFVIILMAREGTKLGKVLSESSERVTVKRPGFFARWKAQRTAKKLLKQQAKSIQNPIQESEPEPLQVSPEIEDEIEQQSELEVPIHLDMIEQRMYDTIMHHPEEAKDLLRLSQEQNFDQFVATLQAKYSQYASYITPERVSHVMAYIAHNPVKEVAPILTLPQVTKPSQYLMSFEEAVRYTGYAETTLRKQLKSGEIEANKNGDKLKVSTLKIRTGHTAHLPAMTVDTVPATNGHAHVRS